MSDDPQPCESCGTVSAAMFFEQSEMSAGVLCHGCLSFLTIKDYWRQVHRRVANDD